LGRSSIPWRFRSATVGGAEIECSKGHKKKKDDRLEHTCLGKRGVWIKMGEKRTLHCLRKDSRCPGTLSIAAISWLPRALPPWQAFAASIPLMLPNRK